MPLTVQGISAAARTAITLRDQLRHGGEPQADEYFRAVSAILDAPWGLAASADLSTAGGAQPALPAWPLTAKYKASLEKAAADDPHLAAAYVRVAALVDPPTALLSPAIQQRVASATAHATS